MLNLDNGIVEIAMACRDNGIVWGRDRLGLVGLWGDRGTMQMKLTYREGNLKMGKIFLPIS